MRRTLLDIFGILAAGAIICAIAAAVIFVILPADDVWRMTVPVPRMTIAKMAPGTTVLSGPGQTLFDEVDYTLIVRNIAAAGRFHVACNAFGSRDDGLIVATDMADIELLAPGEAQELVIRFIDPVARIDHARCDVSRMEGGS